MATVARWDRPAMARDDCAPGEPQRSRPNAGSGSRRDPVGLTAFRLLAEGDCDQSLSRLIESEIIPRLMVAHAAGTPDALSCAGAATVTADDVAALAPLALQVEADSVLTQVEAVLARGVPVDAVMVDLLAPTARLLGEYWEHDRCDFVDVTMGLWRLQAVVHEIADRLPADRRRAGGGRRALFASMPGDQHDFGTVLVDELFRRDGWTTERLSQAATPDLLACAGDEWFDVIGLTVSCDCHIGPLNSIITGLRAVSRNPRVRILVGGRIFNTAPELAAQVGADGTARDARLALQVAADLIRVRDGEMQSR